MRRFIPIFIVLLLRQTIADEVRLLDLDPPEAQKLIDSHDTSLKYAPKIESNVPAVRYLGNEPHNVLEDIYLANQYHGQDGLGGYLYGYGVPDIAKTERKQAGGELRGSYNYILGNGQEIKVEYWDDGSGFHQTDNVPQILPKPVEDTDEVKAAKEEHMRLWQEQAERNSQPVQNPYDNHAAVQGQTSQPHAGQNVQHYRDSQFEGHQSQNKPQYAKLPSQPVNSYQKPSYSQSTGELQGEGARTLSTYQRQPQQKQNQNQQISQQQGDGEDDGEYDPKKYESEEEQGPPKGFFYSFEYPVGIIVSKEGGAAVKDKKHENH